MCHTYHPKLSFSTPLGGQSTIAPQPMNVHPILRTQVASD
jgi:hypothetical protein